jgi:hypothetical protein
LTDPTYLSNQISSTAPSQGLRRHLRENDASTKLRIESTSIPSRVSPGFSRIDHIQLTHKITHSLSLASEYRQRSPRLSIQIWNSKVDTSVTQPLDWSPRVVRSLMPSIHRLDDLAARPRPPSLTPPDHSSEFEDLHTGPPLRASLPLS